MLFKFFIVNLLFILIYCFKCPNYKDIQDPDLTKNFDINCYQGTYYELALHDYTQPSICGCMRSDKKIINNTYIHDNFTMVCPRYKDVKSKIYISDLSFTTTENKGVLNGHWSLLKNIIFPNTIVAVGKSFYNNYYRWIIEFQCVELFNQAIFVGINFYSRDRSEKSYNEMLNAAKKYKIDKYWNNTYLSLRKINHRDCYYE
jgi:hypothetical protein